MGIVPALALLRLGLQQKSAIDNDRLTGAKPGKDFHFAAKIAAASNASDLEVVRVLPGLDDLMKIVTAKSGPRGSSRPQSLPRLPAHIAFRKVSFAYPGCSASALEEIDFEDLPTHFDPYIKGMVRGRTVVRIGPDSHP